MAENNTDPVLELLKSFDLKDLILAFCLSIIVGLFLGALVYVVMTWLSRRRASANITRLPARSSRSTTRSASPRTRPGFNRSGSSAFDRRSNNSLASAAFSIHRQASSSPDQIDSLGRKSSFRASTFHPLIQCSQIARDAEEGSQTTLPTTSASTDSTITIRPTVTPPRSRPRPESFWSNSNLRGFHVTQTPPPAYESVIRAYQETCT
ncbi:myc target protein 1 homolog [Denticeps clupeoides]|uniref:Myc target protein 1 n=1 Tax=Denticeps clupeoides TaxID=299321 RepID=A0AAY4AVG3_9TELE|nr:myc target protein 1 [Denticeps clupeoides]